MSTHEAVSWMQGPLDSGGSNHHTILQGEFKGLNVSDAGTAAFSRADIIDILPVRPVMESWVVAQMRRIDRPLTSEGLQSCTVTIKQLPDCFPNERSSDGQLMGVSRMYRDVFTMR